MKLNNLKLLKRKQKVMGQKSLKQQKNPLTKKIARRRSLMRKRRKIAMTKEKKQSN